MKVWPVDDFRSPTFQSPSGSDWGPSLLAATLQALHEGWRSTKGPRSASASGAEEQCEGFYPQP